jgi:ABC-type lipoprotein release transport system permease subunit
MFDQLDPVPFALGTLLVMAASASAAYFPCRRAARIEPVITLRCD